MADGKAGGPPPAKSWWDTAQARIGVVSALLGLVVAVVGLPQKLAEALGRKTPGPAELQVRAAAEGARPRLDVRYLVLDDALVFHLAHLGAADSAAPRDTLVRSLLAQPVVETEPWGDVATGDGSERLYEPADTAASARATVFLLVRNRGQRDAADVVLHVATLRLGAAVPVREGAAGHGDYAAVLRGGASSRAALDVSIPRTLGPGDGVLVPLFVTRTAGRAAPWWVVSHAALLPDSLTFRDAVLDVRRTDPVRRMLSPTRVATGVEERG